MPDLTNPRAERVKAVRALAGRSARLRHGRYLVEGPQGVRELVREAPDAVVDLYLTPEAAGRHIDILAAAHDAELPVRTATPEVLRAMSPDCQEVLAVARTARVTLGALLAGSPRLVSVLHHVRDPGNAGTVIRASDAAGAGGAVLTEASVDVHNPKVVRSTAGSLFHLPVVTGAPLAEVVAALHAAGLQVLAADGGGEWDLDDLLDLVGDATSAAGAPDLAAPTAWLFGNEAWGLRPEDRALADAVVRVPLHGRAESLNLATAATVCLYASARAQRRS
ncbi:RNA methyltransferase [Actinotalea ferrariae CF5-4]|uniref:RNA methyltransferase n=1 Tax=Actinotalea ferrariae CF5-4 TaxID=948458 RepID=A0A021VUH8_9CELL|nr:RNA methyltransferase [Actinotalea ferrariae]EYR64806.1 RNA methyltransferase [Actinotalea ferrariae CF5-4]